ncbi:MAG: peptide deformylase, partial [Clostridia bacterium]|nr:peptide deformylase [Clostridia bacterium]
MAKRKIVTEGDEVLRTVCKPVPQVTDKTRELLDDMVETMRDANGVGLAAPQVGILRRIVVVETEPGVVYKLVNPVITESS